MTRRLPSFIACATLAGTLLAGCATADQRKTTENAQIKKQAAREIDRICALQGAEREAALEKFRQESGFDLYCSDQ